MPSNLSQTASPAFGFLVIPAPDPVAVVPVGLEVVDGEKYLENFTGVGYEGVMIKKISLRRR